MEQRLSLVSAEYAAAAMKKRRAQILVFSRVEEITLLIFTPLCVSDKDESYVSGTRYS
jgi:hypothetical protein